MLFDKEFGYEKLSRLLPFFLILFSPINSASANEFDKWLDGQSKAKIDKYARQLDRTIGQWISRGEQQVSNGNLNLLILRRARGLAQSAVNDNNKSEKIRLVKESLEKLEQMSDIATLKTFLYVRIIPGVPGKQSVSIGIALLKMISTDLISSVQRSWIKEMIEDGTKSSFRQAMNELAEVENRIFTQ